MSSSKGTPSAVGAPNETDVNGTSFSHDWLKDIQRVRMLAAMAEVASERGVANVTVAHVVASSGVSRRTFYELFSDRDDCFLAAFDSAVACASEYVREAYDPSAKWLDRTRSALISLLRFLDDEPFLGRLAVVESLGASVDAQQRRLQAVAQLTGAVDEARQEVNADEAPPALTAEGVVGAVLSVVHARLLENDDRPFIELANELMSMIVLPYKGVAAARRELRRPVPKATRQRDHGRDRLKRLEMRLTYRTVRVLTAVASHPGASNRHIANVAGITDQGQMSKLLGRLRQLGLIENGGRGPARGEPNAWKLTDAGEGVERAITAQAAGL